MSGWLVLLCVVSGLLMLRLLWVRSAFPRWVYYPDWTSVVLWCVYAWIPIAIVQGGYMHAHGGYNDVQIWFGAVLWPLYWLGSLGVWLGSAGGPV